MNNTLCLGIFAILVYARELNWEYSAGRECHPVIYVSTYVRTSEIPYTNPYIASSCILLTIILYFYIKWGLLY